MDPGEQPRVMENNLNEKITPSAVAFSKKGQLLVGRAAYNLFNAKWEDADNVHIEFKRRMGTEDCFYYPYTGAKYKAEQLSAEVLKELRLSVERRRLEKIESAIITIPAAFEQPQISATKRAAEQAGFENCELLQEPVAASLAYGIREIQSNGYWLVYDLGGGTFDAALVQIKDGLIRVVNHCGDNYLGGKDIDNMLLDRIIMPQLAEKFDLADFVRGEDRWKYAVAKMRYFSEKVKIELSKNDSSDFGIDWIYDPLEEKRIDLGDYELEITQQMISPLYQAVYEKSANFIRELLNQAKINASALEKIILVGGPTQHPELRKNIQDEFGVPLDCTRDVMTVVAEGAAVFASTRKNQCLKSIKVPADSVQINFSYDPSGADSEPNIGGIVELAQSQDPTQYSLEIINQKTQWRSGKVKLNKNGSFMVTAMAEKGLNEYRIELLDTRGIALATYPTSITYNFTGIEVQAKTLMHNISFSEPNGKPYVIFKKGQTLPVKKTTKCQSDHLIKKGSADALTIKLYEGNNSRFANRNTLIGHVKVEAKDMPRDLPAGQDIEIIVKLNDDGDVEGTAEVLIFNMNDPYPIVWNTKNVYQGEIGFSQLDKMKDETFERLVKIRENSVSDSLASEIFLKIEAEDIINQIEETMQAARNDPDQGSKCKNLLLRLHQFLDEIEDRNQRPELEKKAEEAIKYAGRLTEKISDKKEIYKKLASEISEALNDPDYYALVQAVEQMDAFIYSLLSTQPEWWIKGFQFAEENQEQMSDQRKAELLFRQGRKAIDEQDLSALKASVQQLMRLLPSDVQEQAQDFGNVWGSRMN